jgi:hypothetical protein
MCSPRLVHGGGGDDGRQRSASSAWSCRIWCAWACSLGWGNDQRLLLPASALAGGSLLTLADTLARNHRRAAAAAGRRALTALLGVPVFPVTCSDASAGAGRELAIASCGCPVGQHWPPRRLPRPGLDGLRSGESWAILGRNGAGKSTLLSTLAGLRAQQGGRLNVAGLPLPQASRGAGARAMARARGFLSQHQIDPFASTVMETALVGRHPHLGTLGLGIRCRPAPRLGRPRRSGPRRLCRARSAEPFRRRTPASGRGAPARAAARAVSA